MSMPQTAIVLRRSLRRLFLALAAVGSLAFPLQANTAISLPNFASPPGLTFVGDATTVNTQTTDGTVLRLTPSLPTNQAGAAYFTTPITLGTGGYFSTTFQFRFTAVAGHTPGDGITFFLAENPSGLGAVGSDLGYGVAAGVPNSIAVEFDTYKNGAADNNSSNHIAIDTNGQITNTAAQNVYGQADCSTSAYVSGCMSNGDLWTVTIAYNATYLSVTAQDGRSAAPFAAISSFPINIDSYLGGNTAYAGFTSSTGSGSENHNILNWTFDPTTPTPEPATLATLFGGLGALALAKRRRP